MPPSPRRRAPLHSSPRPGFLLPSALSYTNTISRAENNLSSFGKEIGLHFFLTKDEQQMDIVIDMLNDNVEVLYTRTLSNLTFYRHKETRATGTFFTNSTTTTFNFNTSDDTPIDVPLNP